MTTVYYYQIFDATNITAQVALLDAKLLIDLEIPVADYVSTYYNTVTQYVEVTYSSPLGYTPINTLNNLITLIFYNGVLGTDIYYNDFNTGSRRSFGVVTAPTVDHDQSAAYAVGSMIITTSNVIYICTDNTSGAAVWIKVSP